MLLSQRQKISFDVPASTLKAIDKVKQKLGDLQGEEGGGKHDFQVSKPCVEENKHF